MDCTLTAQNKTCLASYANSNKYAYISKKNQILQPNCHLQASQKPPRSFPYLIAIENINEGEEILWDYGDEFYFNDCVINTPNRINDLRKKSKPKNVPINTKTFIKKVPINANTGVRRQQNPLTKSHIIDLVNDKVNEFESSPTFTVMDFTDVMNSLQSISTDDDRVKVTVRTIFHMTITLHDVNTLVNMRYISSTPELRKKFNAVELWLNDNMINVMGLIMCEKYNSSERRIAFIDCFWNTTYEDMNAIQRSYDGRLKGYDETIDMKVGLLELTAEVVIFANHINGSHWTICACYLFPNDDFEPEIVYIDSMSAYQKTANETMDRIINIVHQFAFLNCKTKYEKSNWKKNILRSTQKVQSNGYDCGIYALLHMKQLFVGRNYSGLNVKRMNDIESIEIRTKFLEEIMTYEPKALRKIPERMIVAEFTSEF